MCVCAYLFIIVYFLFTLLCGWQVEQAVRDYHKSFLEKRNEELRVSVNLELGAVPLVRITFMLYKYDT